MESYLSQIKKSVTFIFVPEEGGTLRAQGTGFFVGVRNEANEAVSTVYFVTAKHVIQDPQGHYFPEIVMRLNRLQGDSQLININMKEVKVYEHNDSDVDIAVFACLPMEQVYDFKFIPDVLISHAQLMAAHHISEGDEVFFAGLFMSHLGQKRNQPIIRFGKVALFSDEKIEWKEAHHAPKWIDLYLLECQSFAGNSGSPVFFKLANGQIFLAGIIKGSFLQGSEVQQTPDSKFVFWQSAGISAVTPAGKLHDILFSEGLRQQRLQNV